MMGIKLQGNLCSCGKVWFSIDLPENEPNRCPFCNRKFKFDDILDEDELYQHMSDDVLPDSMNDGLNKVVGNEEMNLVTKICKFCTNELYFDKKDAEHAKYCPYCDDFLVYEKELDSVNLNKLINGSPDDYNNATTGANPVDMFNDTNINELIDITVLVKFKSCNPFNKPVEYLFLGVDFITAQIKFMSVDGSFVWRSLNSIEYIKTIKEKTDESRVSGKHNKR